MNDELPQWKGSPSQWLNLWHYLACILLAAACATGAAFGFLPALFALPLIAAYALWRFLVLRCHRFELSCQRLRLTTGVINQHIDELELYRVKDVLMVRPWWARLTGLSSLTLITSDRTTPTLQIPAVPSGQELREQIRKFVEIQRDRKRVREMDFDDVSEGTLE
jgi:membrane protein YdbS with pleckstrin-like domain